MPIHARTRSGSRSGSRGARFAGALERAGAFAAGFVAVFFVVPPDDELPRPDRPEARLVDLVLVAMRPR
ncbi:hypothetical protein GCM10025877_30150 [Agromyces mangrovi Wang et al. 2018]|nr:hypothetical protein GCM10025877_30150 [Agromyces mangrovi]